MACIACGLGVNADGKGRVDVDPNGGIECQGSGGGLTNVAGSGLKVKLDPASNNMATVGSAGLLVPIPSQYGHEVYTDTYYGPAIAGPGSPNQVTSPTIGLAISNSTSETKFFAFQASIQFPYTDTGLTAVLGLNIDGTAWFTAGQFNLPAGTFISNLTHPVSWFAVPPGETHSAEMRLHLYDGSIASYQLWIAAWGGVGSYATA